MNVKVNDNVLVITGKYKGKQGKILATNPKAGTVIVEGVNIVHKHEKARRANETSRIVTEEAPKKRTRKRSQKAEAEATTPAEDNKE